MSKLFGAFERPVGAAADVLELEYLSALHQTSVLHTDATISASDVLLFLRSRYGFVVTVDDAIDIVKGLSGTARLPLPQIEKKKWTTRKVSTTSNAVPEDAELGQSGPNKRKRCLCIRKDIQDDESDKQAPLDEQWKSMVESNTDTRKGWEFPSLSRQIHREVPRHVERQVRFDLVQMMGMLFIPTILRVKRYRFSEPPPPPPPRPPPFNDRDTVGWHRFIWTMARLGGYVLKMPKVYMQQRYQRHLTAVKESLRPKPPSLILDMLCILLGSLEEREGPVLSSQDMTESRTGSTIQGRYFPELRRTIVTKDLIRKILEHFQLSETAKDDSLVEQMVELVGGEGAVLNERAFAHALTSDVELWAPECEDSDTTTFYDVYGFPSVECNEYAKILKPEDLLAAAPSKDESWSPVTGIQAVSQEDASESFHSAESDLPTKGEMESPLRLGKIPEFKPTASYIDYAVDTVRTVDVSRKLDVHFFHIMLTVRLAYVSQFRSVSFVVYLFGFYLTATGYILALVGYFDVGSIDCEQGFGCELVETIYNWMALAIVLRYVLVKNALVLFVCISFTPSYYILIVFRDAALLSQSR